MFYVINLKRRTDRKQTFLEKWNQINMDQNDLVFSTAVDGSMYKNIQFIKHKLNGFTEKYSNNYNDNPRIYCTILSHLEVWSQIANGDQEFGIVFEDDINFRPDFKKHWDYMKSRINAISQKDKYDILYLGAGDFLPIHTNPPTQSLLDSQEKSHVTKIKYNFMGHPDENSSYIFSWLGAFSYCISKQSAKRLLERAYKYPINKAIDSWLKDNIKPRKRYITVPLLTYHSAFENNVYDSDTLGIGVPQTVDYGTMTEPITFLIPTFNRSTQLLETITSILENAYNPHNVTFAIFIAFKDEDTKKTIEKIKELAASKNSYICTMSGEIKSRNCLHTVYNSLWRCFFRVSTFFAIWDDHTKIETKNWDCNLYHTYKTLGKPNIVTFQLTKKRENPIVSKQFLLELEHVSPIANIEEYIYIVSIISKICIFINTIQIQKLDTDFKMKNPTIIKYLEDLIYNNEHNKDIIMLSSLNLQKSPHYKPCGLWIQLPDNWDEKSTIENPEFFNFE